MSSNMSNLDRGVRAFAIAPLAIIVAFLIGIGSIAGIVLLAVAAVMLATGAVGSCPLYRLLHIDTRGHSPQPH
ncbi:MAG TPA: DUF2892 domain-containing protein [Gaiellaceae bacterium]|nr:DUF2892 domain-containing protein [Gaiellaceae bacterium]